MSQIRIPRELERYSRVTIYAGSEGRKDRLVRLLELGNGKSLSEMVDLAVAEYLKTREVLSGNTDNPQGEHCIAAK